jgi:prepilin-type N-terminal cleavage/methylation domain-containing protein
MTGKINVRKQKGFSLLELLVVVLLLTIVVGAVFSQIDRAQVRYRVEDQKLDMTQQQREFIDQFTRDLHQAGFPSTAQYGTQFDLTSPYAAAGVWYISDSEVRMEGDVDGDGVVDEVVYSYVAGAAPCPCLRRSSTPKLAGLLPSGQTLGSNYTQVEYVVPPGTPVFAAYDVNGGLVSSSLPRSSDAGLKDIKSIRITVTTQGLIKDNDAHKDIQVTMTGMARVVNN